MLTAGSSDLNMLSEARKMGRAAVRCQYENRLGKKRRGIISDWSIQGRSKIMKSAEKRTRAHFPQRFEKRGGRIWLGVQKKKGRIAVLKKKRIL